MKMKKTIRMAAMALSALLCFATTGAYADGTVSLNDGGVDTAKWTAKAGEGDYQALPLEGVAAGTTVTVKYSGTKKVKSVIAEDAVVIVDLSTLTDAYTAQDGDILTNATTYAVTIAAGATVTLNGVIIENQIICAGDATIILAAGSTNKVLATQGAAIRIGPANTTLAIDGTGQLTAQGGNYGAGIGTDDSTPGGNIVIDGGTIIAQGNADAAGIGTGDAYDNTNECGTITINGGIVTATGGNFASGIGTGQAAGISNRCGDITINGGTVIANGGSYASGIGTGFAPQDNLTCGAITIGTGVTKVTATKGVNGSGVNSIGKGADSDFGTYTIGTITIGGTVYWDGSAYQNGGDTYLTQSPLTYMPPTDLSKLTGDFKATDGMTLTGTLVGNYKISIADGATVTLGNVYIDGQGGYDWAGITCAGDATIILANGSTNTVMGFSHNSGIRPATGKKLIIKGGGKLTAGSVGWGAGIGSGYNGRDCGSVEIQGGEITAIGGTYAPGIGGCGFAVCEKIDISGGTVTATGGWGSPGIGSGYYSSCGDITIASTVTSVTATKDANATNSIGAGQEGDCTKVTIGGTVYWNGSAYQNGGDTYLTQDTIVYPAP